MSQQAIDTFMCVHTRDMGALLEVVLRSYTLNFEPKGKFVLVSNDLPALQEFLDQVDWSGQVVLTRDSDWLSRQEIDLPGWYRQQIIKLRAFLFCTSNNFCNLGADTVVLRPVDDADLLCDGQPILYYSRHAVPDNHYWYEWSRVGHMARLLQVKPAMSRRYVDFINDVFCFNRAHLIGLNRYLEKLYGANCYYTLLSPLSDKKTNRFGEWTLYSVYLLDCLRQRATMREATASFLRQVHSARALRHHKFDSKIVHLVAKDVDVNAIISRIVAGDSGLGQYLAQAHAQDAP